MFKLLNTSGSFSTTSSPRNKNLTIYTFFLSFKVQLYHKAVSEMIVFNSHFLRWIKKQKERKILS